MAVRHSFFRCCRTSGIEFPASARSAGSLTPAWRTAIRPGEQAATRGCDLLLGNAGPVVARWWPPPSSTGCSTKATSSPSLATATPSRRAPRGPPAPGQGLPNDRNQRTRNRGGTYCRRINPGCLATSACRTLPELSGSDRRARSPAQVVQAPADTPPIGSGGRPRLASERHDPDQRFRTTQTRRQIGKCGLGLISGRVISEQDGIPFPAATMPTQNAQLASQAVAFCERREVRVAVHSQELDREALPF